MYFSKCCSFFTKGDDDIVIPLDQERLGVANEHIAEAIAAIESIFFRVKEVVELEIFLGEIDRGPCRVMQLRVRKLW